MCPGLSDDLQQIHDARKTAIIDCELSKLKVDIAALQETRLPASGSLKEKDYTFFWQGPSLSGDRKDPLSPPLDLLWTSKHLQRLRPHTLRYSRG